MDPSALEVVVYQEYTLREFCKQCLCALFNETENFSGKYAIGDSDWAWRVAKNLCRSGHFKGSFEFDQFGDLTEIDWVAFDKAICELIEKHL